MEDYVREANELTKLSQAESKQLFDILSAPSDSDQTVNRVNQANALRVDSATLSDRAHALDTPGELDDAQDFFTEALDLRRDALAKVADELPGALATQERRNSTAQIAADDEGLPRQRRAAHEPASSPARPRPEGAGRERHDRQGVAALRPGHPVARSRPSWPTRSPPFARAEAPAPLRALHGDGLGTVSLGGVALTPGGSATVPLTSRHRLRRPGGEPGREHGDRRDRDGERRPGRRRDRGGGVDPRDRRRRGQERRRSPSPSSRRPARTCRSRCG